MSPMGLMPSCIPRFRDWSAAVDSSLIDKATGAVGLGATDPAAAVATRVTGAVTVVTDALCAGTQAPRGRLTWPRRRARGLWATPCRERREAYPRQIKRRASAAHTGVGRAGRRVSHRRIMSVSPRPSSPSDAPRSALRVAAARPPSWASERRHFVVRAWPWPPPRGSYDRGCRAQSRSRRAPARWLPSACSLSHSRCPGCAMRAPSSQLPWRGGGCASRTAGAGVCVPMGFAARQS